VGRVLNVLREWKHLTLLVTLLCLIFAQPVAQTGVAGLIVFDVVITIVSAVIFFVVFQRRSTRIAAMALAAPMVGIHWIARIIGANVAFAAEHVVATLFLGFAVTVILRGIFQPKKLRVDDVLGVICGYLLAGLAWGNLYNLVDTISPAAFSVRSDIAWQLNDESTRRELFDNFSFVTLTCCGDNKVVPLAQTASSLTWLEAVFGQFYMAVVVAQLVGLKLSQAVGRSDIMDT
jgi:voltage-gated potassium channel